MLVLSEWRRGDSCCFENDDCFIAEPFAEVDFGIGFQIAHHDSRIEIKERNSFHFRLRRSIALVHFSGTDRFSMIGIGYIGTVVDELVVVVEVIGYSSLIGSIAGGAFASVGCNLHGLLRYLASLRKVCRFNSAVMTCVVTSARFYVHLRCSRAS